MAEAGEIKKATRARQAASDAYVVLLAQPMLHIRLQIRERRKMGRRPKRLDNGFQNKGEPPKRQFANW
jgi:hypothetical protein